VLQLAVLVGSIPSCVPGSNQCMLVKLAVSCRLMEPVASHTTAVSCDLRLAHDFRSAMGAAAALRLVRTLSCSPAVRTL
jgi:hypothetical protein